MKTFKCNVAQKGFYAGPVYSMQVVMPTECKKALDADAEIKKWRQAAKVLKDSIACTDVSGKNKEIKETVLSIVSDAKFTEMVEDNIRDNSLEAAAAVMKAGEALAGELGKVDSEYIRSRQEDVRGVAYKLISIVQGKEQGPKEFTAICASEISPAQLSSIPEEMIGGMLTDKGSPNSHASILAGNIGIPYLYGNPEAVDAAQKAMFIIIDAEAGTLITDPDEETRTAAAVRMEEVKRLRLEEEAALQEIGEGFKCNTKVYANIEGPQEIDALIASGADGVGLFRTEFLFLGRDSIPTEEEQYDAYRKILEAMGDKEVIIRTMDIGSDKKVSWLKLPEESNPALGMRGVRVSLEKEDVFNTQLRALLRAGTAGNLKIMCPMVASDWEIDEIKERINKAAEQLNEEGIAFKVPELGIMVETPAAAICAEELATKVSFFSIGTNDLTQYTLALDREAQGLDRYFAPYHEAVYKLIGITAEGGHKHGAMTGVCGQLAADPEAVKRLIVAGVDELSVPIRKVKATKKLVAQAEAELAEQAEAEFSAESAAGSAAGYTAGAKSGSTAGFAEELASGSTAKTGTDSAISVAAVADGELIPMAEIPDPVFAQGTMGRCFGILPSSGNVYAPVSGTITCIAETGHAVTIQSDDGRNFMVHVGIDTVNLGSKAFKHHVNVGDHVDGNQLIMEADLEMIKTAGYSTIIIVVDMG